METNVLQTDVTRYLSLLEQRRTIRKLTDGDVGPELFADLEQAIALTPAAFNRPPWRVVIIQRQRQAFWTTVENAFRAKLEGERLERYLQRLREFRSGLGAVLIYKDRSVEHHLRDDQNLPAEIAAAYVQQALGMLQLSIWLALINRGIGTSLQHWDWLIEREIQPHTGLPVDAFELIAVMPFGFPDDDQLSSTRTATTDLVTIDTPFPRRSVDSVWSAFGSLRQRGTGTPPPRSRTR